MKKTNLAIFLLILSLAISLRLFKLDSVPPALFGDEVDVGYQAYSLWETGRDLTGRFMPFYIRSLSEFRTPLYIYSAVPFVGIFGLNEWGVRLPAVFWGIVSIIGIFLLTRKLFDTRIALIAMFLISISPWHLQYSRASFEVTMLLSFIVLGIYCFLQGLNKTRYLFLSAILLVSSIYIYSTAVAFLPLLCLLFLIIYWRQIFKIKKLILASLAITAAIILIPVVTSLYTGEAKERFTLISIFQDSVLIDKINLSRKGQEFYSPEGQIQKANPQFEAIFYNKPLIFAQVFITNYFKSLSPSFLFSQGDINFRHSIHEMGQEYYFEAILLLLGMFALIKLDAKKSALIFGWLIIAPIPASLTNDGGFHATRLFILLPPVIILSAIGGDWIIENFKSIYVRLLAAFVIVLFVFNVTFYLHRYYIHYAPESWRWWHVGFKETMLYMKSQENNYKIVGFNNTYEPSLIRFLFWNKINPADFQASYQETMQKHEIFPGFEGFKFGEKYFFGSASKPLVDSLPANTLYMVSARDEVAGDWDWSKTPPSGISVLKTIRNPLNEPIFYVIVKN